MQIGTPFGYWIKTGVVELGLGLVYMDKKLRHRPKTFMKSPRFKSAIFEFKWKQQRKRQNLSCSLDTIQCSAHISSSRSSNANHCVGN